MPNRRHRNYAPEGRPGLFTELFTVRYTVVTIGSAPGYGHSGSPSSSTGQEGGGGGCGGVLERRKFSPGIPEVISITLKDISLSRVGRDAARRFLRRRRSTTFRLSRLQTWLQTKYTVNRVRDIAHRPVFAACFAVAVQTCKLRLYNAERRRPRSLASGD